MSNPTRNIGEVIVIVVVLAAKALWPPAPKVPLPARGVALPGLEPPWHLKPAASLLAGRGG